MPASTGQREVTLIDDGRQGRKDTPYLGIVPVQDRFTPCDRAGSEVAPVPPEQAVNGVPLDNLREHRISDLAA